MYDISEYWPILWSVVAIHIVVGIFVVTKYVIPRVGSPKKLRETENRDIKLTLMFELYRASFTDSDHKPWAYVYAGIFKYLQLIAMTLIFLVVANVALKNG